MKRSEIFEILKKFIINGLDNGEDVVKNATEDSNLQTDIGLDSVGMLYLVISMEDALEISFDDVSFNDFETVKDVIDYIEAKKGKK